MPSEGGYQNNAACVGGGTLSYGAHGLALHGAGLPHALHLRRAGRAARSKTGPSPTTIWSRIYEKAEWEIGVSGDVLGQSVQGPRRKPLPMPPLPPNREYQIL